MGEETEISQGGEAAAIGLDAEAVSIALGSASRAEADALLRQQRRFVELQTEHLHEQRQLQLSRLRLGRFSDRARAALQVMTGAVGIAIVAGMAVAMWKASQAEGIVVDSFSVPPQFTQAGISGQVVADDLTNRIAIIRDRANAASLARSKDVRQNGDEIKIEIPETGISLGQAWRYLRAWLGHERRLTGNLRLAGEGKIALGVALEGAGAASFSGASGDLEKVEQQAAERIFELEDPVNYVVYLSATGRPMEALAAVAGNVQSSRTPGERADAFALWGLVTAFAGDPALGLARARLGAAIDPYASAPHMEIWQAAALLGHDEEVLLQARTVAERRDWVDPDWRDSNGVAAVMERANLIRDEQTGDFTRAISDACVFGNTCETSAPSLQRAEDAARMHDLGRAREQIGEALAMEAPAGWSGAQMASQEALARARYFMDGSAGNWQRAAADARAVVQAGGARTNALVAAFRLKSQMAPLLAIALARSGNLQGAEATIAPAPADCYACLRARALIAASAREAAQADGWFARAVAAGPSLPFAYTEWGQALLARGQPDAAMEKFKLANEKGPHFADPLEGWGEALMAKSQSHLALAKFAEAERYAPNWGRLHLKWGESLYYTGRKDEARAQFARAAQLDLTPSEKSELARMTHG